MVIGSQRFDPLKRHSNATKGINSRLWWTKYSDLHEMERSLVAFPRFSSATVDLIARNEGHKNNTFCDCTRTIE